MNEGSLMTVSDLACYLTVSKSLVYKWVEEGRIPHYRFGKTVRFDPSQVKEWLELQRIKPETSTMADNQFERDVDKILNSTRIATKL